MDFDELNSFFDEFEQNEDLKSAKNELTNLFEKDAYQPQKTIDSYTQVIQDEIQKRLSYIRFIESRIDGGWTQKNLSNLLIEASSTLPLPAPSWRTLVNWKKAYYDSGKSVHALVFWSNRSGHLDCG